MSWLLAFWIFNTFNGTLTMSTQRFESEVVCMKAGELLADELVQSKEHNIRYKCINIRQ